MLMEKIVRDESTEVMMSGDEAKLICKLGKGEKVCAFLCIGSKGFECIRMLYPTNVTIFARLEAGTMVAKGEGGWKDCAWEKELKSESN
jgi:hypothetical protein